MKPTAMLMNLTRGEIVDQAAFYDAMAAKRIRGAALDVFEKGPADADDPILHVDNAIVTPHALCWTDEWAHITGQSAIGGILAVAAGQAPNYVVNKEVLNS